MSSKFTNRTCSERTLDSADAAYERGWALLNSSAIEWTDNEMSTEETSSTV